MKTALVVALAAFASIQSAFAENFTFAFTGGGLNVGGSIVGTLVSPNYYESEGVGGIAEYEITDGFIVIRGTPSSSVLNEIPGTPFITGFGSLVPCGDPFHGCHYANHLFYTDTLFMPSDPLSAGDILFRLSGAGMPFFQVSSSEFFEAVNVGRDYESFDGSGQFSITPEPSSLWMLGTALFIFVFGLRKRRQNPAT